MGFYLNKVVIQNLLLRNNLNAEQVKVLKKVLKL